MFSLKKIAHKGFKASSCWFYIVNIVAADGQGNRAAVALTWSFQNIPIPALQWLIIFPQKWNMTTQ